MAVTANSLLNEGSATDSTSFTSVGTPAPADNALVLAVVTNSLGTGAAPNSVTLSGGGMSAWTLVRSDVYDSGGSTQSRMTLFRALEATPGTGTVTAATSPSQTATGWNIKIIELAGIETAGTNGSGALADVVYRSVGSAFSVSVTLSDVPFNATCGFVVHQANESMTPGSGFALVGSSTGHDTPGEAVGAEFRADHDRTVDASWATSSRGAIYAIGLLEPIVTPTPPALVGSAGWGTEWGGDRWIPGLRIGVEVGLSSATSTYGVWDTALWNAATWGPDDVWVDVSAWLRAPLRTRRRFARDVQAWETGEAEVVLGNGDGRFSPSNLSGPYVTGGVTQIRPWRPVRVRASYGGVIYNVFRGYVVAWNEQYASANSDATVTLRCVDEQAKLAMFDGFEQAEQGSGEAAGVRLHRILNNAGHTGQRDLDVGVVTMQPTTLAQNAVSEMKLVVDSEGGALWVEGDGSLVFEDRHALIENTRSNTVQATFGDLPSDWLPATDVEMRYDGDLVVNYVSFARENGTAVTTADAASRALYGDFQYTRHDLVCETEAQVKGLADWYIERFKDAELRATQVTFKPRIRPGALVPQALGRRVRDLVRALRRPPGGDDIQRDCFISGIAHTFGRGEWDVTFELASATPYTQFQSSRWDVAEWDTALWFH